MELFVFVVVSVKGNTGASEFCSFYFEMHGVNWEWICLDPGTTLPSMK